MMKKKSSEELDLLISRLLRGGVLLAAVLIFSGWALTLSSTSQRTFEVFKTYEAKPLWIGLRQNFESGDVAHLVSYAGLLVLILLPTLRVFTTFCVFVREKDYKMSAVAAFVLLSLVVSYLLGLSH